LRGADTTLLVTKRARSKPQSSAHSAGSPFASAGAGASAASAASSAAASSAHAHPHAHAPTPDIEPIPIDRPGLVETLGDFLHSSAWEALSHFGAPASAAELAAALGRTASAVQASLDALERLGIVRRLAATARARRIRYEVTTQKVVIPIV
jgi:hypothetical protein